MSDPSPLKSRSNPTQMSYPRFFGSFQAISKTRADYNSLAPIEQTQADDEPTLASSAQLS